MADTKIQWADKVWNPVTGCSKVSQGCKNCYAKTLHDMRHKAYLEGKKLPEQYSSPFEEVRCHEERLQIPAHWKKPQRIFVNSMSDLFHPDVPFEFIDRVWESMFNCQQHIFMILTKRPDRMNEYFDFVLRRARDQFNDDELIEDPLPNVWLGVSVENQETADERIPFLLQTPAAVRFISAEPLLGEILINNCDPTKYNADHPGIDWVICGGESGKNARPMHPEWVMLLRNQCKLINVPFFFKQWGEWKSIELRGKPWFQTDDHKNYQFIKVGKKKAGRLLDGIEHNEFPKCK